MRARLANVVICSGLLLSSCGSSIEAPQREPADFSVTLDESQSFALYNDRERARQLATRVRAELLKSDMMSGDRVTIHRINAQTPHGEMAEVLPIDRAHRKLAVANELYRRIASTPDRANGGSKSTDLLFALQHTEIRCSNGRGIAWILTDALPDDATDFSDWRGLVAGTIQLPPPVTTPFRRCRSVSMLGVGMLAEGMKPLSAKGVATLIDQWRIWFSAAGLSDPSNFRAISGF